MTDWSALETPLNEAPLFLVEPPDGRKDWGELPRQTELFRLMRMSAPSVQGYAIPNAGKRNPMLAKREGIRAGLFDTEWPWNRGIAWIEMKGYDKNGRPGELSQAQIDWGNMMTRCGFPVACFFDPVNAINWLRDQGAPVRLLKLGL